MCIVFCTDVLDGMMVALAMATLNLLHPIIIKRAAIKYAEDSEGEAALSMNGIHAR